MVERRPNFNEAVRALLEHVASSMEEFRHIQADRILVVAGEARRASRGTVKPLTFPGARSVDALGRRKPVVRIRGRRMLYCITLRPLFFRASTPRTRVGTLLHELFHISNRFDGTLHPGRRHARLGRQFPGLLRPIVQRYLRHIPPEVFAPFAYHGEVRVLHWLERPGPPVRAGERLGRRVYTEEQLFQGVLRMETRRTRPLRAGRARPKLH
ncbi:MAG: hypothetical protein L0Y66_24900 [Myxococcaceae bacterium]|nr:hypothetical protein [Myxococcaceae bacterium]MCI0671265.1 hypothetical protein [Myxococcaceae bacterium]